MDVVLQMDVSLRTIPQTDAPVMMLPMSTSQLVLHLRHQLITSRRNTEVDELYEAQMCKLDHIIKKAKIQEGSRILEIGSGWGSMAIRIAQRIHGTTIDTITQSSQQQDLAQKRVAAQGLSNRITVHLMDYRSMPPEWEDAFDRVISVEMLENVGKEYYNTYWKIIDWALKPRTGAGVVQVITIPEASTFELSFVSCCLHAR